MNKEDSKYFNMRTNNTIKCKCGHSVVFNATTDKKLCTWCGNYVYKEHKDEFKNILLKRLYH